MTSIRRRLTLSLVSVFCLLWLVGGTVLYLMIRAGLIAEFDSALKATAQALASVTEEGATGIHLDLDPRSMPGFQKGHFPDYFEVWGGEGSVLQRSASLEGGQLSLRPVEGNVRKCWNLRLPDGRSGRAFLLRFFPHADQDTPPLHASQATLTVIVARHRLRLDRRLELFATTLLVVGVLLTVGTLVLTPAIVRRALVALDDLGERAATIDAFSLRRRLPTDSLPTELVPIAQRLNDLLARLESSFERERQFTADAAHELRTPLAELRSLAEVSLHWPDDAVATRRVFQDVLETTLKMERTVTVLLALARCDRKHPPIPLQSEVVADLVRGSWQHFTERAAGRGLVVTCEVPADLHTVTNRDLFGLILTNLFANATEYTPSGGAIRIRTEQADGRFRLLIANPTDHLTAADLPHLWERFWRKDTARTAGEHTGLGLALAKSAAELLGLALTATLAEGVLVIVLDGPSTQSLPQPEPVKCRS